MLKTAPNPIDRGVGAKVRSFRLSAGLSQEKLGAALGVSFQQVQKYESGANRIGASRLHQIAIALNTTPSSFFDDAMLPQETAPSPADERNAFAADFLSSDDGRRFLRAMGELRDAKTLKSIVDLIVALAASGSGDVQERRSIRPAA